MADETETPQDNETIKAAKGAKAVAGEKKALNWKTAAGIGIGSAAVVAALIYANKNRNKDD